MEGMTKGRGKRGRGGMGRPEREGKMGELRGNSALLVGGIECPCCSVKLRSDVLFNKQIL